ncbi:MAG: TIGR03619 family F420-dependent LLM class oxidoreductase [Gammaproteobacteria bacterium]|nr:TIGR03619 family F420-dependent LLM class oxidoreductase [Gammaproteobacteria bacterium]
MQIGFNLPVSGPMATAATMAETARLGESLGFDYLTLTDHVALPDTSTPGYPYSESGQFYSPDPGHRFEQLTAAAWIAARTESIRLVLAVMVVPHRPAVLSAKMLSTIDVLSGGRLVVGIGAGWLQPEIEAVATTPFAERGAVTDEYIDAFKAIWTQERPRFQGRYTRIDGLLVDPKPIQKPHPPIWVGGESGPSMRRAARVGDAWYPIGSNNANLLDSLPRLEAGIARLRKLTEAAGRDPASVGITYRVKRHAYQAPPASDGNRRLFTGTVADTIRDIETLRGLGVTAIDFDFEGRDAARSAAAMRSFRETVMDKL